MFGVPGMGIVFTGFISVREPYEALYTVGGTNDWGGCFFPDAKGTVQTNRFSSEIKINFHDGQSFSCLSGDVFLKSLRETESTFKIKLFVNA